MGFHGKRRAVLVRRCFPVASMITALAIALAVARCGDTSEPPSTAETQTQGSTTTQEESPVVDATAALGVTLTSATAGEPGVVVQAVEPDSTSRLRPGDVIIACNGIPVASPDELIRAIGTPDVGDEFRIRVVRGSERFTLAEVQTPTAYLGANIKAATGNPKGAVVVTVIENGPAAKAGLQRGDLITAADDTAVGGVDELLQIIGAHGPGETISLAVSRGSRHLQLTATLAHRPTQGAGG